MANAARVALASIKCKCLLFHSLDDPIAVYADLADSIKRNSFEGVRLVNLHGLGHFIHESLSTEATRNLALVHFGLMTDEAEDRAAQRGLLAEMFVQRSQESGRWSALLFSLMGGFFALFGVLLSATLPDVLRGPRGEDPASIPYYLIAYVMAISIYLNMAGLHFFYVNRIDTYIKHHVEPLLTGQGWTTFRNNPWASSKTSSIITTSVAEAVLLTPLIMATGCLGYVDWEYGHRLGFLASDNYVLTIWFLIALMTWVGSLSAIHRLRKYTKEVVFGMVRPKTTTFIFERHLSDLLQSVSPPRNQASAQMAVAQEVAVAHEVAHE